MGKGNIKRRLRVFLILMPIVVGFVALCIGRYMVEPKQVIDVLTNQFLGFPEIVEDIDLSVVWKIRLPRIFLSMLVGMGLAVSGAAFQGLFSNPLATPDTLGVAAGAAFGAALGLLLTSNMFLVQIIALIFGIIAVGLTHAISKIKGISTNLMIVLAGMVTSAFFQALISLIKYVADPETKLPAITYWLMGSMSSISFNALMTGAPFILVGVTILYILRWKLNILALSEDEAKTMGINVTYLRGLVIVASTLITASTVSMCGQVGWVGLLIPHTARMLVGSNNQKVIPVSIGLGSTYMIIIDTLARSAIAAEIPLSILTALIGAPFFAYLLRKTGGGWR
ncbi:iron complex transport system permease protein [Tissierella praeacuta DSM 18095]|uniref:Iron complex transport system permease protein n=1 Tax=Tissierella praeacuta DSM 18095 TaxID=1123404 RepID=A0A1M4TPP5_9FIRM|nr:iron ABC transporter permease [Tissierella praeacuta]SHE46257.1 iron complex transport system permease protein [Tissierella praeacuta DSM 18095]SUP04440.1 Probable ABC transporter permease protein HI_1471 [Tissierella praeacuta]